MTTNSYRDNAFVHSHSSALRRALGILVTLLAVASLLAITPAGAAHAASREMRIKSAFDVARAQKGDPYVYGAAGPNKFDCSGLIQYAYRRANLRIPRTSTGQAQAVKRIKRKNLRRGDLVFYTAGGRVYHVGLFAGRKDGRVQVLHSPRPGQRVKTERTWTNQWFAGTFRR